MRNAIIALLGDVELAGGWATPFEVDSGQMPRTPFGIVRLADAFTHTRVIEMERVVVEVYIHDRRVVKGKRMIASYASIDAALKEVYTALNGAKLDEGYTRLAYDSTSPDLMDDGWGTIFKFARYTCVRSHNA